MTDKGLNEARELFDGLTDSVMDFCRTKFQALLMGKDIGSTERLAMEYFDAHRTELAMKLYQLEKHHDLHPEVLFMECGRFRMYFKVLGYIYSELCVLTDETLELNKGLESILTEELVAAEELEDN